MKVNGREQEKRITFRDEVRKHIPRARKQCYEYILPIVEIRLAEHFKNNNLQVVDDPILETQLFEDQFFELYLRPMNKAKRLVEEAFTNAGIAFRLDDLADVFHDLNKIGFSHLTNSGNMVVFSVLFPSDYDNDDAFVYRIGEINLAGSVVRGDTESHMNHPFTEALPAWYISELRFN